VRIAEALVMREKPARITPVAIGMTGGGSAVGLLRHMTEDEHSLSRSINERLALSPEHAGEKWRREPRGARGKQPAGENVARVMHAQIAA